MIIVNLDNVDQWIAQARRAGNEDFAIALEHRKTSLMRRAEIERHKIIRLNRRDLSRRLVAASAACVCAVLLLGAGCALPIFERREVRPATNGPAASEMPALPILRTTGLAVALPPIRRIISFNGSAGATGYIVTWWTAKESHTVQTSSTSITVLPVSKDRVFAFAVATNSAGMASANSNTAFYPPYTPDRMLIDCSVSVRLMDSTDGQTWEDSLVYTPAVALFNDGTRERLYRGVGATNALTVMAFNPLNQ